MELLTPAQRARVLVNGRRIEAAASADIDAGKAFRTRRGPVGDPVFLEWLKDAQLPAPVTEYRFAPPRRWRFDYAWPDHKVALEVDGGAWTQGRHTRGKGFIADQEKRNAATAAGWGVFNVTPDTLATNATIVMLATAIHNRTVGGSA